MQSWQPGKKREEVPLSPKPPPHAWTSWGASAQGLVSSVPSILHTPEAAALQTPPRAEGEFHHLRPVGCFSSLFCLLFNHQSSQAASAKRNDTLSSQAVPIARNPSEARGLPAKQKGGGMGKRCPSEEERPGERFLLCFAPPQGAMGTSELGANTESHYSTEDPEVPISPSCSSLGSATGEREQREGKRKGGRGMKGRERRVMQRQGKAEAVGAAVPGTGQAAAPGEASEGIEQSCSKRFFFFLRDSSCFPAAMKQRKGAEGPIAASSPSISATPSCWSVNQSPHYPQLNPCSG